jgi:hypothetical protein
MGNASLFFLCLSGAVASMQSLKAQATGQPMPEYSNGALEITVEHAKPDPRITEKGQNLYGILTVSLKNVSDEPLTVALGSPDCDFAIDIRDSSGSPPKLTPLGEYLPKSEAERAECAGVSNRMEKLQPGEETFVRWYIRKLFQLEPGRPYNIKVTWAKGLPAATPSGRQLRRQLSRTLTIR